jgi:isocitrate/isopropylmalate dehydrogenase
MATYKLLLLAGDGIGPEVMAEVKKLITWMNARGMGRFETEEGLVGGTCYDAHKVAITDETMAKAHAADCGCARISACSRISDRRSAIPRWRTPPASSATWWTGSTSSSCGN